MVWSARCLRLLWSLTLRHAAWHEVTKLQRRCIFFFLSLLCPSFFPVSSCGTSTLTLKGNEPVSCTCLRVPTAAFNLPNVPNVFLTPAPRCYICLSCSQPQHCLKKNATSSAWLFRRMGWFQMLSDLSPQKQRKQTFTTQSRETELQHQ